MNLHCQNIGLEFAKKYYDLISNKGVNHVLELFNFNALCTVDLDEFRGAYNWLLKMTKAGISHFEYKNLSVICQPLNNCEIIIAVCGNLKPINLWGQQNYSWLQFNEIFILDKFSDNFLIKNYILRTF